MAKDSTPLLPFGICAIALFMALGGALIYGLLRPETRIGRLVDRDPNHLLITQFLQAHMENPSSLQIVAWGDPLPLGDSRVSVTIHFQAAHRTGEPWLGSAKFTISDGVLERVGDP